MLAKTPEWVGDATAWIALATSAAMMSVGVARFVNRGLDVKIGHKIDTTVHDLKDWIKSQFDEDRTENSERWRLNGEQHAAVVERIDGLDRRLSDTESFLEHQIENRRFER
jgi:hypothetical protein